MKALKLTIRLKNNLLLARRKALGLTQHALCEKLHLSKPEYNYLENMRKYPFGPQRYLKGKPFKWSPMARTLARFYKVTPQELFPEVFKFIVKPYVEKFIDTVDTQSLLSCISEFSQNNAAGTEKLLESRELHTQLLAALSTLEPKQRVVVGLYYGVHPLPGETSSSTQIGRFLGVSAQRALQMKDEALMLLRRRLMRAGYRDN